MSSDAQYKIEIYHWHQLIQQACDYAGIQLDPALKSYLLLTIYRYLHDEQLAIEATRMTANAITPKHNRTEQLTKHAEHSLILAGLFPSIINNRNQRISYFISLGTSCYQQLAETAAREDRAIYQQLADHFSQLLDVLYALKILNGEPALAPLQAMELWSDTGSQSAFQALTQNLTMNRSLPLNEAFISNTYKH